jgi:hypothetical protein
MLLLGLLQMALLLLAQLYFFCRSGQRIEDAVGFMVEIRLKF